MRRALVLFLFLFAHSVSAQDYSTPYGEWRGHAQYQAKVGTELDSSAHAVVMTVIEIDPSGKVRGFSQENGCRMLGVAQPGVVASAVALDVTFSGCHYAGFNRRFSGSLFVNATRKHANLSLRAQQLQFHGTRPFFADIKATFRR